MVFSSAWSDPMMIKEAVNSPRHRGEMNHSKHHYRLFWTCLRPHPRPAPRAERRGDLLRGAWPWNIRRASDKWSLLWDSEPGTRGEVRGGPLQRSLSRKQKLILSNYHSIFYVCDDTSTFYWILSVQQNDPRTFNKDAKGDESLYLTIFKKNE